MSEIKPFKKPNLNAPRFRPTVLSLLNKELFDKFIDEYPEYKDVIDCDTFKNIINTFDRNITKTVINNRDGVELPESLGFLFIGSCAPPKKKRTNVNYGESIKQNTLVINRNFGSDSFLCKIFYTNCTSKYRFLHREVWQFEASKEFSKAVSDNYKLNWKTYIQVENNLKISQLYKTKVKVKFLEQNRHEAPEEYNEFDLD